MKTDTINSSRIVGTILAGAILSFGLCYSSMGNAAQGCGYGSHMNPNGRCVPNNPGAGATGVPGRPDCWRNANGNLRCYR